MRKKVNFAQFEEPVVLSESEKRAYETDPGNIACGMAFNECSAEEIERLPIVATWDFEGSELTYEPEEDGLYSHRILKTINGAEVKTHLPYEEYKVPVQEGGEQKIGYRVTIESRRLADIFQQTPYGIIKKNRTGVGATYLEMNCQRNSIIVVPTKALAYIKAIQGYDAQTHKFKYLYVGSEFRRNSLTFPSIDEYISDETVEYKKIIVVADSLGKVIEKIGVSVFKKYFLMVDEIDIYQSDSFFRPALEKVIDYYFKFNKHSRCLVTATLQGFSNPKINCEPTIDMKYTTPELRTQSLIHSDNPNAIVKEKIEELFANHPNEKIVVAFNKVKFIRQIIQNLSEECRAECAIFCSEASEEHAGAYYRDFIGEQLPARIIFMTNPFFAGLDFGERFHLISVSNVKLIYTLLSPERLQQIAGRCRHEDGLYSETIVYNTEAYEGDINDPNSYQDYLLEYADKLSKYINHTDEMKKYARYGFTDSVIKEIKEFIFKKSERYYFKDKKMSIVRENVITKRYLPAYFNIDSLYDTVKLHIDLYTAPEQLSQILSTPDREIPFQTQNRAYTEIQRQNDQLIENEYEQVERQTIDIIADRIRSAAGLQGFSLERFLNEIQRDYSRDGEKYILCFKELYKFIPFERLLEELKEKYNHKKEYRGYHNAVIFWALAEDHSFKVSMRAKFPIRNEVMSTTEIKNKANEICTQLLSREAFSGNVSAVQFVNEFIRMEPVSRRGYRVVSYNKFGFEGIPLNIIREDVRTLLKYSGE